MNERNECTRHDLIVFIFQTFVHFSFNQNVQWFLCINYSMKNEASNLDELKIYLNDPKIHLNEPKTHEK